MRELTKEEVLELDSVWLLIKTGRAPDKDAKAKAINVIFFIIVLFCN